MFKFIRSCNDAWFNRDQRFNVERNFVVMRVCLREFVRCMNCQSKTVGCTFACEVDICFFHLQYNFESSFLSWTDNTLRIGEWIEVVIAVRSPIWARYIFRESQVRCNRSFEQIFSMQQVRSVANSIHCDKLSEVFKKIHSYTGNFNFTFECKVTGNFPKCFYNVALGFYWIIHTYFTNLIQSFISLIFFFWQGLVVVNRVQYLAEVEFWDVEFGLGADCYGGKRNLRENNW